MLGDPWFWGNAWEKLQLLDPGRPVDLSILDFHLMAEWLEKRENLGNTFPSCYYVDMRTLDNSTTLSICSLRQRLSLPIDSPLPMEPVFLLVRRDRGPLLLIFNYFEECTLILGGLENKGEAAVPPWIANLWVSVAELFNWKIQPLRFDRIFHRDWIKVGLQFGIEVPRLTYVNLGKFCFWAEGCLFLRECDQRQLEMDKRWIWHARTTSLSL